jgi:hypothetical protein
MKALLKKNKLKLIFYYLFGRSGKTSSLPNCALRVSVAHSPTRAFLWPVAQLGSAVRAFGPASPASARWAGPVALLPLLLRPSKNAALSQAFPAPRPQPAPSPYHTACRGILGLHEWRKLIFLGPSWCRLSG